MEVNICPTSESSNAPSATTPTGKEADTTILDRASVSIATTNTPKTSYYLIHRCWTCDQTSLTFSDATRCGKFGCNAEWNGADLWISKATTEEEELVEVDIDELLKGSKWSNRAVRRVTREEKWVKCFGM